MGRVSDLLAVIERQERQIAALTAAAERQERAEAERQERQERQLADLTDALTRQGAALTALVAASSRPEVGAHLLVRDLRKLYEPIITTRKAPTSIRGQLAAACEFFGDRPVLSLTQGQYVAWRDNTRAKFVTQRKALIAPGTLNQELHAFLAMLNWGVREGHIGRNPLAGKTSRDGIRPLPVDPLETVLSIEDEAAVLRVANPVLQVMFTIGVDAGLRLNEIRLLEWTWIDLERGRIKLPGSITKTRKGRTARISDRVVGLLRALPRMLRCPWLFTNPDTKEPWSKNTIEGWWRKVRDEADLRPAPGEGPVRFHSATRHTAATRMAKLAPAKVVMKQLGQSSAQVFMRYAHAAEEDLDEMQAKLNASLTVRRPPQSAQRVETESTDVNTGSATKS
jgi:integrase